MIAVCLLDGVSDTGLRTNVTTPAGINCFRLIFILFVGISAAFGQPGQIEAPSPTALRYLDGGSLGSYREWRYAEALGDRVMRPGKERSTLTGTLTTNTAKVSMRVVRELHGRFRIEELRQNGKVISFDGLRVAGKAGEMDESLAESLGSDSPEAFLLQIAEGTAPRFIGGRFRTDGGTGTGYQGQYVDVYQTFVPDRGGSKQAPVGKLFMFDSDTALLARIAFDVVPVNQKPKRVEVMYGDWRFSGGQKVAGRIVRIEDGKEIWRFEVEGIQFGGVANDIAF